MSDELYLEKLKIAERLSILETKLQEHNDAILKMLDRHDKSLYGINGTPGLVTHVDRLNTAEENRSKHFGYVWTAIIGLAGKFGYDLLHK